MKLLVIYLVFLPNILLAQTNAPEYVYSKITEYPTNIYLSLNIENGTKDQDFMDKNSMITQDSLKGKFFVSIIDFLNFMSAKGWELISTHSEVVKIKETFEVGFSTESLLYYFFRRKLSEEEKRKYIERH